MALAIPTGVSSNGTVIVTWVPTLADPEAPTVAEIAAGVDLSCYMTTTGLALSVNQTTTTARRLCSTDDYTIGGSTTWTLGDLQYVWDPQGLYADTNDAYAALVPDTTGFIVIRWGKDAEVAIAAADIVDVFTVTLQKQIPQTPEADSELYVNQPVIVSGSVHRDVAVVA